MRRRKRPFLSLGPALILLLVVVQSLCAFFFVGEIAMTLLGLPYTPLDWRMREGVEIAASLGLILGIVLGALILRRSWIRARRAEAALRAASAAFMDLLEQRFEDWRLTPAERDVALFAVKGLSTGEIAQLRRTSEGTVKAQTNAIYRKAGVGSRSQLLSLFLDDLIDDEIFGGRRNAGEVAQLAEARKPPPRKTG